MEDPLNKFEKLQRQVEILMVEDNVADLLLMMKFFKESPVKNRVNVVREGMAAMDYLNRVNGFEDAVRPDLILLDLNLPGKDGREVLREVKKDPALQAIPVVIVTDSNDPEEVTKAYENKANFYMIKPSDMEQFLTSMKYLELVWVKKAEAQEPERAKTRRQVAVHEKKGDMVRVFMVEENMGDVSWMREALNIHSRFIELNMVKSWGEMVERFSGFQDGSSLPDVVLMDLSEPQTPDWKLLTRIRFNGALADIPVVILTSPGSEAEIRRTLDDPSIFCVRKTRKPDELFGAIHHIITYNVKKVLV